MILGIDTSLGTAVAVVEADGVVRADLGSDNPLGHAEVIGELLQRAVAAASDPAVDGAPPPDAGAEIAYVAAGMGPGPFTGLRVGIAAARAFALGRGIPVLPVVSHDAAALEHLIESVVAGEPLRRFAIVTDARRREFAYTVYDDLDDDGLPVRAVEPALIPRDELDARLAELGAERRDVTRISAAMVALVAARALTAGREPGPADALYLRSPDVTMPAGPKKVGV
ncbi:tRNA (adenosine(37)-N6)-threonylcarbamoyltransferase complex dimerization subunit type 1 TsaB [Microbacterium terricola]|uniref:tRNA (Adenosine(37)-N6)-threonylcarbamoyltransferase complex dimerization subunit type 1 TsaB n=1 Tax=Microbacterium terricola TaxID=344163 RepID=A0ABM8DVV6_9MICO|nr:tRNA (adenosine(37)-N6)-threonylcarbamoyltransferase complex dimerization subunit type 1 TsaB [Microbacterium terricola]UYK39464.1 tRNA (adenosine(37)-N6)-threonylcarbamoyltransferase complex dimerization subunit type 1 TsaB [Microbacterium terricola]BDV29808.1 tRNA (adenosine(37)-N6)-threonylcarbamoyltransferase complex dimerization subunit type 1 TsaB [Microbacterium terricola]